ncbi:MAG: MBL fold metallo-hydrolase [Candidatus Sericytochromatia bacterium]
MIIEKVVVGAFQCNCTIIGCEETKEALIIDPGDEPEKIKAVLKKHDLKPKYLLHTHAHLDHIMGTRNIKENNLNSEILLHKADLNIYNRLKMQASIFGFKVEDPLTPDRFLEDEETLALGKEIKLKVIHTPGHSPGSICFHFDKLAKPMVFSGDTLFSGSVGRTDLWEASHSQMISSIKNRLFSLEDETIVCPGHGDSTTVWKEKKTNPFFV